MYSLIYTFMMCVLWVIGLCNGTGLGAMYKTTETAMVCTVVVTMICLASQSLKDGDLFVKPRYFYTIIPLVVLVLGNLFIKGYSLLDIKAFWPFMLVYILSKTQPNDTAIRMTAIAYGCMGLVVLLCFNFTDILKGWNANSIAMIGLFSFVAFTIPFFGMREWRSFVMMPLIGAAYVLLILPTGSRSCILIVAIQLLITLRVIPVRKVLESKRGIMLLMQIPLLVAVLVIMTSLFGDMSGLKEWSYEVTGKPLFNSRDELWIMGFRAWSKHPLFGDGGLRVYAWHNCAIAVLVSIGAVGYCLWNRMFCLILQEGKPYLDDTCTIGGVVAFLTIYGQQSMELGIYSDAPALIPYIVLGIILGRIRYLKGKKPQ